MEAARVIHKSFNLTLSADIVVFIYTSEGNLPAGTDNLTSFQTKTDRASRSSLMRVLPPENNLSFSEIMELDLGK